MILTCAFGLPWLGHWSQPCLWCQTESDRLAAEYAAQVKSEIQK